MSKRLQITLSDAEYRTVKVAAERQGKPVSRIVRESLQRTLAGYGEPDPEKRIAAVLSFARFSGPTGDIEQLVAEIELGHQLPPLSQQATMAPVRSTR